MFAGPNGSGKSTVIEYVRRYVSKGRKIDFGYYINADDIAQLLRKKEFCFATFDVICSNKEFRNVATNSGLIGENLSEDLFKSGYKLFRNKIKLKDLSLAEQLAQIIADFLRKKLLAERKRFSFETVFSHVSKLEIMKQAIASGYKVYLYFVSTESPEINKFRVEARKKKGGHDVPAEKIVSRYFRSLELLYDASQLAYQAFFFDNSENEAEFKMFANFKNVKGKKKWSKLDDNQFPDWFRLNYSNKV